MLKADQRLFCRFSVKTKEIFGKNEPGKYINYYHKALDINGSKFRPYTCLILQTVQL